MISIPRPGERIRLVAMHDDPDPMKAGETGTVVLASRHGVGKEVWHQVDVDWDDGRQLMLVVPPDEFEFIDGPV